MEGLTLSYNQPEQERALINTLSSLERQLIGRQFQSQLETEAAQNLLLVIGPFIKSLRLREAVKEAEHYKKLYEEALARIPKE